MAEDGSVLITARLDTSDVERQSKGLQKTLDGITWDGITKGDEAAQRLSGSLKGAGKTATVGLTAPVVAAGAAVFGVASDYEQATAQIQTALGLTSNEAERLSKTAQGIYERGFGESLGAVNEAVIDVTNSLGELDEEDLSYVTQAALTLSDTMGMDVGETVRGVNALVDGFGMSATDAMDLFVAGAQRGLDYSGELGDNLAEYGPRFAQMGFSAEDYFSILQTGAENGAYSLDKVNDFLNEFQTSLVDGRMDEQIGNFSQATQELFQSWKDGGATGQEVFEAVIGELGSMASETDRARIASDLWSSLGEDNAMGMITSLAGVESSYGDVAGAAGEAAASAQDSFGGKMTEALRTLKGAVEPLGEPLLNIATRVAEVVGDFAEWFGGIGPQAQGFIVTVAGIAAGIGPVLTGVGSLVSALPGLSSGFTMVKGAISAVGAAVAANPLGALLTVIGLVVTAVMNLWTTNEDFRNAVTEIWGNITEFFGGVWEGVSGFFTDLGEGFGNLLTSAQGAWDGITEKVSGAWESITSTCSEKAEAVSSWLSEKWEGIKTAAGSAWDNVTEKVSGAWESITSSCAEKAQAVATGLSTTWENVKQTASDRWNDTRDAISGAWDLITGNNSENAEKFKSTLTGAYDAIDQATGGTFGKVVGTISDAWENMKSKTSTAWENIKNSIMTPIQNACDFVGGIVDTIKGFFNFDFQWPHIPLPHISYDLIEVPILGSIPNPATLSIQWYATGGVFNGPSVIGVGEAGPEAVVPLTGRRMDPFADAVADRLAARGGDTNVTISVTVNAAIREGMDIDRVSRELADRVAREMRRRGLAAG